MTPVSDQRVNEAVRLMTGFADRTGLTSKQTQRRYLWTDAFAVCNLLGLADATGNDRYRALALQLIEQVHYTLGRHRDDDPRSGWISGLDGEEGALHPTRGGLRIGKALPERAPGEPLDQRSEWDRDGQYFHYLTKWMHCLDQTARATRQPVYNLWARELAITARERFTYPSPDGGGPRMYWKMSIDLSRPLVASMGHHDPLDGYVTAVQLQATASRRTGAEPRPDVADAARTFASMIDPDSMTTADPLGIGGLLTDAWRVEQLRRQGADWPDGLLEGLLSGALAGLVHYRRQGELRYPASRRLAFRELGLAIGLRAVALMLEAVAADPARHPGGSKLRSLLDELRRYVSLGTEIESFWRETENQAVTTWTEHRDINEVMLATSLVPDGFLVLY